MKKEQPVLLPMAPQYTKEEREWRAKAACKGMDTSIFFPERGENKKVKKAKEVCSGCSVQQECAAYSLMFADNNITGIWGGMAGRDRRRVVPRGPETQFENWTRE